LRSNVKYPRLNRRHMGVMIWLLEHPAATLTECAKALGYSRPWLSRIVNSPEFRAQHRQLLQDCASLSTMRTLGLL
jgi:DNA-binding MarR family transcriptional regulator